MAQLSSRSFCVTQKVKKGFCSPCCRATWWPHPSGHSHGLHLTTPFKSGRRQQWCVTYLQTNISRLHRAHPPHPHRGARPSINRCENEPPRNTFTAFHDLNRPVLITLCRFRWRKRKWKPSLWFVKGFFFFETGSWQYKGSAYPKKKNLTLILSNDGLLVIS